MPKVSTLPPQPSKPAQHEPKDREDVTQKLDFEALVSPTKGILLTPGIGTTRRKNVTFWGVGSDEKSKAKDGSRGSQLGGAISEVSSSRSQAASLTENQPRQTRLTAALYRAKDGISGGNLISSPSENGSSKKVAGDRENDRAVDRIENEGNNLSVATDLTIDLNNPQSRSGQYWKAEFEQYQKNSGREMKKILKVSQNVKSFAAKKDSEASDLSEKLKQALSKEAEMKRKVTDLAAQLRATETQDLKETPDQTRLFNDLARQTALAIQYKQKADKYEHALLERSMSLTSDTDEPEDAPQRTRVESNRCMLNPSSSGPLRQDMASLRSELDKFRSSAEASKAKAAKLEMENSALRGEINKLRKEMEISELKRRSRETMPQKREEVLKASNADGDARLPAHSIKNEPLLQDVGRHTKGSPTSERKLAKDRNEVSSKNTSQDKVMTGQNTGGQVHSKPRKRSNTYEPESSMADIWILGGQDNTPRPEKPRKNRAPVEHSSKVLKEITQNRVLENANPKPHRTTLNSIPSHENSPLSKIQPSYESPHRSTSLSSSKRLSTPGAEQTPARPSTTSSSPRPLSLTSASNPPEPLASAQHHPTRPFIPSHRERQSKSIINSPIQIKSTIDQNASLGPLVVPVHSEAEGRKESDMPVPVDRKAAMRARQAERMARRMEKAKERVGIGMGMGMGVEA